MKTMNKLFCPYCGMRLDEGCNCLKEIAEMKAEAIEEYENRPDVQYGWRQQDMIDLRRREQ